MIGIQLRLGSVSGDEGDALMRLSPHDEVCRGEPSPGADVAGLSLVPVSTVPGADVDGMSPIPLSPVPDADAGGGEPSPGADVAGVSPVAV